MDKNEIRIKNLIFLRDHECGGKRSKLSELTGIVGPMLTRYWAKGAKRPAGMSSMMARRIEKNTGKPVGWMDVVRKHHIGYKYEGLHEKWDQLNEMDKTAVNQFMDYIIHAKKET